MSLYKSSSLVMIPTAYKDGKLYSVRPTDGSGDFTFSRGSNLAATRVDVNGLIEKGRENLVLYSQDFSQANWATNSLINVSYNNTDPNGGNTAFKAESSGNAYIYQDITTTIGNVYVWSFYAKSDTPTSVNIRVDSNTTPISLTTEWQRFDKFFTASSTTTRVWCGAGFTWGAGEVVYLAFAQAEQGLVATDYIETGASTAQAGILEDMPRLDYSGSCPALLLEPQRTNFVTDSEYFAGLNLYGSISATYGAYTNPSGNDSAYLLEATSAISRIQTLSSTGDGNSAVMSIFIKGNDNVSYPTLANQGGGQYTRWEFDANNVLTYYDGDAPSGDYGQEDYGNGWYRIWLKTDTINGSTNYYRFNPDNRYGVGSLYAWGFQVEKNSSYPTSYIPTYGSSVTRSYDDCDLLDLVSKDIITDSTEWTIMFEVDGFSTEYNSPDGQWYAGQNGTLDVYMRPNGTADVYAKFYWRKDGKYIGGTLGKKMIARLSGGTGTTFVDGILDGSSSITGDYSGIGFNKTSNPSAAGYVKQILVFPTALTDSECIALTTL